MRFHIQFGFVLMASIVLLTLGSSCLASRVEHDREVVTYSSSGGNRRFTVTPSSYRDARRTDRVPCVGKLELQDSGGDWRVVWERTLPNPVAPRAALVSDSTDHVVTFGESMRGFVLRGPVPRAVVVYGQNGEIEWQLSRQELLSDEEVARIGRAWSGVHYLDDVDGDVVVLIATPFENPLEVKRKYRELRLRIVDGARNE